MPHKKTQKKKLQGSFPNIRLIEVKEDIASGIERRRKIQRLLCQMLLRANKRGRPSQKEDPSEVDYAA
jgi:hypothetical protein